MPRWRAATWVLIIWSLVMGGVVVMVMAPGSSCDGLPWWEAIACSWADLQSALPPLTAGLIWFNGLIVIGAMWQASRSREDEGRYVPHPTGSPEPRISRSHEGSDADALVSAAAADVAEWQAAGLSLVEAAWVSRPTTEIADSLRLRIAFGDPRTHFARLWPDGEDAMEVVLARVSGLTQQASPMVSSSTTAATRWQP